MKTIFKLALALVFTICNYSENKQIEITLISPESETVSKSEILLEGLITDITVTEMKLMVNQKELEYLPVKKGYFAKPIRLDQRENHVALFGANFKREHFRKEYLFINKSIPEKSPEEKVPPRLELNHLKPDSFTVLGSERFHDLKVRYWDNKGKITQLAYIVDDGKPQYIQPDDTGIASLKLLTDPYRASHLLHIYAIDEDNNKTSHNYHFRIENMTCNVQVIPLMGYEEKTLLFPYLKIKGGKEPYAQEFYFIDERGTKETLTTSSTTPMFMPAARNKVSEIFTSAKVTDSNGVTASCKASVPTTLYPVNHPLTIEIKKIQFESNRQEAILSIEPPVKSLEAGIMLKKNDSLTGVTGEEWKFLANVKAPASDNYKRYWTIVTEKRLQVGDYLLKMSVASEGFSELKFTRSLKIHVSRAANDDMDLLQQILQSEYGNE
jgi:hypothetical protein